MPEAAPRRQALGLPTRVALGLEQGTPRHYDFKLQDGEGGGGGGRRALVESVYASLNEAGEAVGGGEAGRHDVVVEAYALGCSAACNNAWRTHNP